MSGYTSGKFSHDPMPWLHDHNAEWCSDNGDRMATNNGVGNIYSPRSRFDNHNPILVWLRAASEDRLMRAQYGPSLVPLLAGDFLVPGALEHYSAEHIAHARRVLEKLAALS